MTARLPHHIDRLVCCLIIAALALPAMPAAAGTIVGGSSLIGIGELGQLEGWLGEGPLRITRIFTRVPGDGKTAADFHAAANAQGRTFTVIQVLPTNGNASQVIGGYNPQSWTSSGSYNITVPLADRTGFLFNLTSNSEQTQRTDSSIGQYQTYNHLSYGPTFGGGHDIWVNGSWSGYVYPFSYGNGSQNILGGTGYVPAVDYGVVEVFTVEVDLCGNGVIDPGEQCDDSNSLSGDCCSSTCQYEANGSPCTDDGEACTADVCDGAGTCTHPAGNGGATCRAAAGDCDVVELCDGATPSCPADALLGAGTSCRAPADLCDAEELCDGLSPLCPTDGVLGAGSECRAAAGDCDVAEQCDGSSPACPADALQLAGVECRAASPGEACDIAESCTGVDADCPADGFALLGTPCRAAVDDCDVAEACTGASSACPADAKQADDTPCDDADTCSQTDTCQAGVCTGADPLDCDDGNPCSTDACDPMGGCVNDDSPASGCLSPGKSIVLIKDSDDDTKDKLLFKWLKGAALEQADLADPTTGSGYALCIYAGTANALVADAAIPPGPSWAAIGTKGYKFKGTSPDGLQLAILKGGAAGKSKALTKGKGAALPDPTLPLAYPVTVQLRKTDAALCLESVFDALDEKKNTATQFKAKN